MVLKKHNVKLMTFCNAYKKCTVVYMITNPIGQSYIGSTTNLYKRLFGHCNSHKYANRHVTLIMKSIEEYGFYNHEIDILWSVPEYNMEKGYEMEAFFIKQKNTWRLENPNGLNLRKSNTDNSHLAGKIRTCKPVHQYDMKTGNYIASFVSTHEAARSLNVYKKVTTTAISDARDGKQRFAYGFFWHSEKLENYIPVEVDWLTLRTPVYKMDKSCTTIHERYKTIQDAFKKNKIKRNDMFDAVENVKEIGGFYYLKAI